MIAGRREKRRMKVLPLLAIVAFSTAGCVVEEPAVVPGSVRATSQESVGPRKAVESIRIPKLQLCVLKAGAPPSSLLGGTSPACISRIAFEPSGIAPQRTAGEFGVILSLKPEDQT